MSAPPVAVFLPAAPCCRDRFASSCVANSAATGASGIALGPDPGLGNTVCDRCCPPFAWPTALGFVRGVPPEARPGYGCLSKSTRSSSGNTIVIAFVIFLRDRGGLRRPALDAPVVSCGAAVDGRIGLLCFLHGEQLRRHVVPDQPDHAPGPVCAPARLAPLAASGAKPVTTRRLKCWRLRRCVAPRSVQ